MGTATAVKDPFEMLRTSIENEYKQFLKLSHADTEEPFYQILENKINGNPLRARFIYALYQYIKEEGYSPDEKKAFFFEQQLPFILEVIISIQYYHNQILDGKGNVTTPEAINRNLIIGNLLKDQLYRYIEEKIDLPLDDIQKIKQCVRIIFELVDIGQYIEKHHNTYEAYCDKNLNHPFNGILNKHLDDKIIKNLSNIIIDFIDPENEFDYDREYLQLYLTRIYATNTVLFSLSTDLITTLLEVHEFDKNKMIQFATLVGLACQITNDNCDFVPSYAPGNTGSVAKCPRDAFSDLRNRNITLPLFIHLKRISNDYTIDYLKNEQEVNHMLFSRMEELDYYREITRSLSIYYAMSIAKDIKARAISLLNSENIKFPYTENILEHLDNNRYYKFLYSKGYYKKYQKEIHTQKKEIRTIFKKAILSFSF